MIKRYLVVALFRSETHKILAISIYFIVMHVVRVFLRNIAVKARLHRSHVLIPHAIGREVYHALLLSFLKINMLHVAHPEVALCHLCQFAFLAVVDI